MTDIPPPPTLGLVLAGGLARRMGGGDKARIEIGGVSILDRVLATLSGEERIVFDQDLASVEEESSKHRRKAAVHDE